MTCYVAHLDLDAFFASCAELADPQLQGRPVIVGSNGPRGVVATANYNARRYGITSAMPVSEARRRCRNVTVVEPDFDRYRAHSVAVMAALAPYATVIERVSLDEAYFTPDTDRCDAMFATAVRDAVAAHCQLSASIGVAPSRQAAKLASENAKPGGVTFVDAIQHAAFLAQHSVEALAGYGPATAARCSGLGFETVGDLAATDLNTLISRLGVSHATTLWRAARGEGSAEVTWPEPSRSVGVERTLATDEPTSECVKRYRELVGRTIGRLEHEGFAATTVTAHLRRPDFTDHTRTVRADTPTRKRATLEQLADEAFAAAANTVPVTRLVGVQLGGLRRGEQLDLFADDDVVVVARPPQPGDHVHHNLFGNGIVYDRQLDDVVVRFEDRGRVVSSGSLTVTDVRQ